VCSDEGIAYGVAGQYDHVTYNFYGTVNAPGSQFGESSDGHCCSDWHVRRPTGVLRDAEVAATVSNYVPPSTFQEAVARLRRDHLVVLAGGPGSGRRAGALALLREVTGGGLVVLSPAETARELAGRGFLRQHGYLVIDGDGVGSPGTDPAWAEVASRVRAAGSYLVVATSPARSPAVPPAVPYLPWEPPPAAEVLRGHLTGSWAKDDVDRLVASLTGRLPARCAPEWLACLARLVNAGRDPAQALAELDDLDGRPVDHWFSQPRTSRELAEVTVAAFLTGTTDRAYRSRLAQLERVLRNRHAAARSRPSWTLGSGLLRVRRLTSPSSATRMVSFKEPSYRRFALARIWDTSPSWFLSAVRAWLDSRATGVDQLEVTSGLALLATSHFEEVESAFLEPWSLGRLGHPGEVSAAYLLWYMCRDESTAPLALRTAIRWSRSADPHQRATAVLAFGGELGACYPTDAARRLWQLMLQPDDVRAAGSAALGRLFALLVDQAHQAGMILTMLDAHRYRSGAIADGSGMAHVTVEAVRSILTARSYRTGRPAVAELLKTEPEWLEVVAQLLAGVLQSPTAHLDGITALWDLLHAFPHTSPEPIADAHSLGRALAAALTTTERAQLRIELTGLDRRLRRNRPGRSSPADPLVACLAAVAVPG
jgi:hypothetical protein